MERLFKRIEELNWTISLINCSISLYSARGLEIVIMKVEELNKIIMRLLAGINQQLNRDFQKLNTVLEIVIMKV